MFLKTDAGIPLDLRVGYRRRDWGTYNVERVRGYLRKESWMQQERSYSRARQAGTWLCNRVVRRGGSSDPQETEAGQRRTVAVCRPAAPPCDEGPLRLKVILSHTPTRSGGFSPSPHRLPSASEPALRWGGFMLTADECKKYSAQCK